MSIFFNLGSLILGIISWVIPIIAYSQLKRGNKLSNFAIYSFASCLIALIFQLFEIKHRVNIHDFSAIMDTINAICFVSIILVTITTLLNIIATNLHKTKNK